MKKLLEWARSKRVRFGVIGLYVLTLFLLIGAYIGISTFRVESSAYVRAQSSLEKGRPVATRGALIETTTGKFRRGSNWTFDFVPDGSESTATTIADVSSDRWGVLESTFEVPSDLETGKGTLRMTVSGPDFPTFYASSEVEIAESSREAVEWPERTPRLPREDRSEVTRQAVTNSSGSIAVDLLPGDGELVRGLENTFFVRTYRRDSGEPVSCRVEFESVEGMGRWGAMREGDDTPTVVDTDRLGLGAVNLSPVGGQKIELRADECGADESGDDEGETLPTGEATAHLHTVAAQFSLSLDDPLVDKGGVLRGEVESVFDSKRLFVDLFGGRDWVDADSVAVRDGRTSLKVSLPAQSDPHWLSRVQLYEELYGAGLAWESAWFVRADGRQPSDYRDAFEKLAVRVADATDDPYFRYLTDAERLDAVEAGTDRWKRWLKAATKAMPRHFSSVEPLYNTQKDDEDELAVWKKGTKGRLMTIIAAALIGALAVLIWVVLQGLGERRAHKRRLREVDIEMAGEQAEDGADADLEEPVDTLGTGSGLGAILLVVIALATFVMFGLGVLMVLTFM